MREKAKWVPIVLSQRRVNGGMRVESWRDIHPGLPAPWRHANTVKGHHGNSDESQPVCISTRDYLVRLCLLLGIQFVFVSSVKQAIFYNWAHRNSLTDTPVLSELFNWMTLIDHLSSYYEVVRVYQDAY